MFGPSTLTLLRRLSASPDAPTFAALRPDYRDHWVAPARAFVEAARGPLADLAPRLQAEPRVHGSILSPRQDVRFADRPPYRDHVGLVFWEGDRATATSVLFLRVHADRVVLGAGARRLDRDQLRTWRRAVVDPTDGRWLVAAVGEVEARGWTVHGHSLARGPRGVHTDDPDRQRLLRHTAAWAQADLDHPGVLGRRRFVDWCVRRWAQVLPLHRWLVDHLPARSG